VAAGESGSGEEILNVAQPANLVVQKILALAGAIEPARDRNSFAGRELEREIAARQCRFCGVFGAVNPQSDRLAVSRRVLFWCALGQRDRD
jgi:hypothetical protein